MKKILLLFIASCLMLVLHACGQIGPLYFPDEESPIHVEPEEE